MPVLDLSFEWPVDDAGYSIVKHKRKPSKGEWPVDESGFSIGEHKPKQPKRRGAQILTGPSGPHIVRKGGQLRTTRPLESHSTLFMEFAHLDGTDEESCLRFASKYGYLGLIPGLGKADDPVGPLGEPLSEWREQITNMRHAVGAWQAIPDTFGSSREIPITRLDVSLVPIDGRPTLRIRPRSLIGAILLQFAQAVSTNLDIRTCRHCGKLFETGGTGRTRKARFCSDRCRNDYHIARRKTS